MSRITEGKATDSMVKEATPTTMGGRERRPCRLWLLLAGAAVTAAAMVALATLPAPSSATARSLASRHGLQSQVSGRVPLSLASAASASIGASDQSFWPLRHGASLLADGGGIRSTFTASGATLRVAQGSLDLSLAAVGYGQGLKRPPEASPSVAGSEVLYRQGFVSEFYRSGPYGLEQGFAVQQPQRPGTGPLVLALRLGGSLAPQQVGSEVVFRTQAGTQALHYGRLSAVDATGRQLAAVMQLRNGILELRIDDSNARYPLRIDPFIQQGEKLTSSGETLGYSVTLSSEGNTALIGGPGDDNGGSGEYTKGVGAVWVFTRSGTTWTQQGAKLTGSGESGEGSFGRSVALSSEGNTALIGGPSDNKGVGAVWVFTRSGTTWTQQGAKLTGSAESGEGSFGASVALSAEGNTAMIGGPGDSNGVGAVWVFTRSGSTWTQQGAKLTGSGETGEASFGTRVALSSGGNTALIGGPGDSEHVGAAWVFTRSGSTWTQQGTKLTGSGETGKGYFGSGVALSSEGNTAMVGGLGDNSYVGAAWVFTRSGTTWTQQGEKLTGIGEVGHANFGESVALSSEGNMALIGGPADNSYVGAAWVFTRSGTTWTQQGEKLTGIGEVGQGIFGSSVALSSGGNTALIGGYNNNGAEEIYGAAWAFVNQAAAAPGVVTESASTITQTSATLNATVNPYGEAVTQCYFEYGPTQTYGSTAPCTSLPGSGEFRVAVSASITGLVANMTYHFRIVATNETGTSKGTDQTLPNPPTVVTEMPGSVTHTSATLYATVNPNGSEVSECKLEYGTTTAYGQSAPCTPSAGSGNSKVFVYALVTGLSGNTTYHFRISARNLGGTSNGSDAKFTTLPWPHYYENGSIIKEGVKVPVVDWGTLTLTSSLGVLRCHGAIAGYVENPTGGGAGVGQVQSWDTYECSASECPAETRVEVYGVPLALELTEEVFIRIGNEAKPMDWVWGCWTGAPTGPGNVSTAERGTLVQPLFNFNGTLTPRFGNGTTAGKPSRLEFKGGLYNSEGFGEGHITGEIAIIGFREEETISANV